MAKNRPEWIAPIMPQKARAGFVSPAFKDAGRQYGFGGPAMRRCDAIARSTGERCGCAAMALSTKCKTHGGMNDRAHRAKNAYGDVVVVIAPGTARRRYLASIATPEAWRAYLDEGGPFLGDRNIVERGEILEAWTNRQNNPAAWLNLVKKYQTRNSRDSR